MDRGRVIYLAGLGLLSFAAAAPAAAAPAAPDKNASARVSINRPATLRKLEDLNFGCLIVTGAGTAIVNPDTDALTTTGGVIQTGANCPAYAALFEAVSPQKGVVIVRIPKNPITVTRVGGTETMTVSNWTLSGNSNRTVAAQEPFAFAVGGTLTVRANQADGLYTGTFAVDIQYP